MECEHKNKKDLTQGTGEYRHFYCPACGWHDYNGEEYSREKWGKIFQGSDYSDDWD